jgi:hypothetical protein
LHDNLKPSAQLAQILKITPAMMERRTLVASFVERFSILRLLSNKGLRSTKIAQSHPLIPIKSLATRRSVFDCARCFASRLVPLYPRLRRGGGGISGARCQIALRSVTFVLSPAATAPTMPPPLMVMKLPAVLQGIIVCH